MYIWRQLHYSSPLECRVCMPESVLLVYVVLRTRTIKGKCYCRLKEKSQIKNLNIMNIYYKNTLRTKHHEFCTEKWNLS